MATDDFFFYHGNFEANWKTNFVTFLLYLSRDLNKQQSVEKRSIDWNKQLPETNILKPNALIHAQNQTTNDLLIL